MFDRKIQRIALGDDVVVAVSRRDESEPAAYSMRRTGPDAHHAARNIADFAGRVGFDVNRLVMPRRWPHLGRVMVVSNDDLVPDPVSGLNPNLPKADKPGFEHSCDGLITMAHGLYLGAQGADCPMLYLYDSVLGIIGAIHCGWKPVAQHIVTTAVRQFEWLGSNPMNIRAFVSAGAGDNVYEFAIDDASRLLLEAQGRVADFEALMAPHGTKPGTKVLRLNALVVHDLTRAGVPLSNILCDWRSCIEDPTLHSYRRDGGPDMATSLHGLGIGVIFLN
ncbi:MAG TPA: polyphenol oxidase family protein [Candidatus Saccharimonadales bacterium]|nr:polyphenol oxidase family protein [Candidatus Saccharimonadales bacterium]